MRAQDLMPLAQIECIDLVNLQTSSEGRELARFAADAIDPLQAPLALDEFAAALAATDVTVSVDTMAAHCAGADWAAAVEAVAAVLRAGRTEPHSVFGHGAA